MNKQTIFVLSAIFGVALAQNSCKFGLSCTGEYTDTEADEQVSFSGYCVGGNCVHPNECSNLIASSGESCYNPTQGKEGTCDDAAGTFLGTCVTEGETCVHLEQCVIPDVCATLPDDYPCAFFHGEIKYGFCYSKTCRPHTRCQDPQATASTTCHNTVKNGLCSVEPGTVGARCAFSDGSFDSLDDPAYSTDDDTSTTTPFDFSTGLCIAGECFPKFACQLGDSTSATLCDFAGETGSCSFQPGTHSAECVVPESLPSDSCPEGESCQDSTGSGTCLNGTCVSDVCSQSGTINTSCTLISGGPGVCAGKAGDNTYSQCVPFDYPCTLSDSTQIDCTIKDSTENVKGFCQNAKCRPKSVCETESATENTMCTMLNEEMGYCNPNGLGLLNAKCVAPGSSLGVPKCDDLTTCTVPGSGGRDGFCKKGVCGEHWICEIPNSPPTKTCNNLIGTAGKCSEKPGTPEAKCVIPNVCANAPDAQPCASMGGEMKDAFCYSKTCRPHTRCQDPQATAVTTCRNKEKSGLCIQEPGTFGARCIFSDGSKDSLDDPAYSTDDDTSTTTPFDFSTAVDIVQKALAGLC